MQINTYQAKAARTIDKSLPSVGMEYHALHGMCAEVGEIHSLYQKTYQGHLLQDEHLKKELGDLLWFIAEYCTANGWMLEDIAKMNIAKLRARYPDGFDPTRSLYRKAGDI